MLGECFNVDCYYRLFLGVASIAIIEKIVNSNKIELLFLISIGKPLKPPTFNYRAPKTPLSMEIFTF